MSSIVRLQVGFDGYLIFDMKDISVLSAKFFAEDQVRVECSMDGEFWIVSSDFGSMFFYTDNPIYRWLRFASKAKSTLELTIVKDTHGQDTAALRNDGLPATPSK